MLEERFVQLPRQAQQKVLTFMMQVARAGSWHHLLPLHLPPFTIVASSVNSLTHLLDLYGKVEREEEELAKPVATPFISVGRTRREQLLSNLFSRIPVFEMAEVHLGDVPF